MPRPFGLLSVLVLSSGCAGLSSVEIGVADAALVEVDDHDAKRLIAPGSGDARKDVAVRGVNGTYHVSFSRQGGAIHGPGGRELLDGARVVHGNGSAEWLLGANNDTYMISGYATRLDSQSDYTAPGVMTTSTSYYDFAVVTPWDNVTSITELTPPDGDIGTALFVTSLGFYSLGGLWWYLNDFQPIAADDTLSQVLVYGSAAAGTALLPWAAWQWFGPTFRSDVPIPPHKSPPKPPPPAARPAPATTTPAPATPTPATPAPATPAPATPATPDAPAPSAPPPPATDTPAPTTTTTPSPATTTPSPAPTTP